MLRFIETIKLLDGQLHNLDYHQHRVDKVFRKFFEMREAFDLSNYLYRQGVPGKGLFKGRIVYDNEIKSVEFLPYLIKPIRSLKIMESDVIEYNFKFENRNELAALFDRRGNADDVIIVKNGMVTDGSYANLLFKRGNEWFTPTRYLLNGTMRQNLLDKGLIKEETISINDVRKFEKVKLINSMLGFDGEEIPTSQILY